MLLFIIKIYRKIKTSCFAYINKYILLKNKVLHKNFNINGIINIRNSGVIRIGKNFRANSGKNHNPIGGDTILRLITSNKNAKLIIGDNVGISNSTIFCANSIYIGNNMFVGGSCKIWDTDFHSIDPINRIFKGDVGAKTSPIYIDDCAFIGGGSIILKGVKIGKNSVIAAASVVTKSIPDNEIWGGNPARLIKVIEK